VTSWGKADFAHLIPKSTNFTPLGPMPISKENWKTRLHSTGVQSPSTETNSGASYEDKETPFNTHIFKLTHFNQSRKRGKKKKSRALSKLLTEQVNIKKEDLQECKITEVVLDVNLVFLVWRVKTKPLY
jgi:hypothetical protein